jgi:hypothetical protein
MITNISASGNRGLFYFDLFVSGGSQLHSLPSVVCGDFSATRYWGIKTGMIEELDPRLNAAEALESRLAAAEYGFWTAYDDPLFNLTDSGDNVYMNEIVTAYASTGDGDADLSNGCDLVSQHFESVLAAIAKSLHCDLNFTLTFSNCPAISNILQFLSTISHFVTIRVGEDESYMYFDIDHNDAKLVDLNSRM